MVESTLICFQQSYTRLRHRLTAIFRPAIVASTVKRAGSVPVCGLHAASSQDDSDELAGLGRREGD